MKQLLILWIFLAVTGVQAALGATVAPGTSKPVQPVDTSRFDTKLPIEISSDTLEVLQHENKAIFTGNVIAVQGTVRLKSDIMIVHYQQKSAPANGAKPAPPPPSGGAAPASSSPMGAITLIEVKGNVFVATPEESAKGDFGDYTVATKIIHLFGSNVVLTREKDILRGTALEYNLDTGRSLLTNNGVPAQGADGQIHSVVQPGRVRGVFMPSDDKPGDKKPEKKKPAVQPVDATQSPPAGNVVPTVR